MFERFTEGARQVVVLAQDEARGLRHNYIGTEHLLLGLLRDREGVARRVLLELNVDAGGVREATFELLGDERPAGYDVAIDVPPGVVARRGIFGHLAYAVPMLVGAGLLGAGILVGWLIWG